MCICVYVCIYVYIAKFLSLKHENLIIRYIKNVFDFFHGKSFIISLNINLMKKMNPFQSVKFLHLLSLFSGITETATLTH